MSHSLLEEGLVVETLGQLLDRIGGDDHAHNSTGRPLAEGSTHARVQVLSTELLLSLVVAHCSDLLGGELRRLRLGWRHLHRHLGSWLLGRHGGWLVSTAASKCGEGACLEDRVLRLVLLRLLLLV